MAWLMAKIYDRFMAGTEEACLRAWRSELLEGVHGDVLEIGAGTGANMAYYGDDVDSVVATEPDAHMRAQLEAKLDGVTCVLAPAEALPFEDESFDFVVSTLVLCSVDSLEGALAEIRRVLRPGGELIFLEHVESHREVRRRWQHRIEPVWSRLAGNCHLTRDTAGAIQSAGLEIVDMERESMRKALSILRETVRGRARRPLEQ